MSSKFIQLTSGWIPVSVMLLFAVTLVAGEDRADLSPEAGAAPDATVLTDNVSLLDLNGQARLAAVRQIAENALPLAEKVELVIDVSVYPVNDEMTAASGRLE